MMDWCPETLSTGRRYFGEALRSQDGNKMKRTQVLVNFITAFGLLYTCSGGAQVIGGIYFIFILPLFETWSNVWTGLWGVICGITTLLLSCFGGGLTSGRAQAILLLSISVGCCNAVNMIIMEIGEWRIFEHSQAGAADGHHTTHFQHLTTADFGETTASGGAATSFYPGFPRNDTSFGQSSVPQRDTMSIPAQDPDPFTAEIIKSLLSYAYLTTTISTAAALVSSFIASQYILCFMYRNEKSKQAGHPDAFGSNIRPEDEAPGLASPWLQRQETCRQYAMWMDKLYREQQEEDESPIPRNSRRGPCVLQHSSSAYLGHGYCQSNNDVPPLSGAGRTATDRNGRDGRTGRLNNAPGRPHHGKHAHKTTSNSHHLMFHSRHNSFSSTTTLASQYSSLRSLDSTKGRPRATAGTGYDGGEDGNHDEQHVRRLRDAYGTRITNGLHGVPGLGPAIPTSLSRGASCADTGDQTPHQSHHPHVVNNALYDMQHHEYGNACSTISSLGAPLSVSSSAAPPMRQAVRNHPLTQHRKLSGISSNGQNKTPSNHHHRLSSYSDSSGGTHLPPSSAAPSSSSHRHSASASVPLDRLLLVPSEQLQVSSSSSSSSAGSSIYSGHYQSLGSRGGRKSSYSCPRDLAALRSLPSIPDSAIPHHPHPEEEHIQPEYEAVGEVEI